MTIPVSQISNNQSFGTWLQRTNDIASIISSNVVTTDATGGGSITTGRGFVNGAFGTNTFYVTNIRAGNLTTNGTQITVTSNVYSNATICVGNSTINAVFIGWDSGNNTVIDAYSDANTFTMISHQNFSNGASASADLMLFNDNNLESFLDIGINSSNYSNSFFSITDPNGSYIIASNSSISIGTDVAKFIKFFANGTLANNEVMRITPGANVAIGTTVADAKFKVVGAANVVGNVAIVGSLLVNSTANVLGAAAFANTLTTVGIANLQSNVNIGDSLTVANDATVTANLTVNGEVSFANSLTISGVTNAAALNTSGLANLNNMNTNVANAANVNIGSTFRISTINSSSNGVLANSSSIAVGNSTVNTTITQNSVVSNTVTTYNLIVTGTIFGAFSANGNIVPSVNNSFLVGTSVNVFAQAYITNVYSNAIYSYSGPVTIASNVNMAGVMSIGNTKFSVTNTFSYTTNAVATVDSFSATTFRSAEYTIQAVDSNTNAYHFTKLLVTHDGVTAYVAEFGVITNLGNIVTFAVDINSGNVRLRGTPTSNTISIKYSRDTMTV